MKTKFTSIFLLSFFLFSLSISAQTITNGLVAYYPFSGNARDSSGNFNDGTVHGVVPTTDRFGNANGAYLFDGFSSYIEIPSSTSLESPATTNQISMSAWVSLNGESLVSVPFDPIMQKTNSTEDVFMYRMGVDTGLSNVYSTYNTDAVNYIGPFKFTLQTWYLLTTTFNGSEVKSYVNGALVSTLPAGITIAADSHSLSIGRDPQGISEFFNGAIDDISIYNRALSDSEVLALYTGSVLPVTLTKFTATNEGNNKVSIAWRSVNEINTDKYIVERSIGGTPFQKLSDVSARKGVSNDYTFDDMDVAGLQSNTVYYRLQEVDKNGSFVYSAIVPVKLDAFAKTIIYPNPASTFINVKIKSEQAGQIGLHFFNMEGKVVLAKEYTIAAGTISFPLNIAALAKGMYIVKITGKYTSQTLSFTKQ